MRYEDSSQAGAVSNQSDGQGPEARDDMDTVAAGARGPVTGNVISGEGTQFGAASSDLSADDAAVTAVSGAGGQDASFSGGKLAVTGEYGKLSIDAEGNYSYLANQGAPENSRDRFTYTLADKQGNSDTAALTIEIGKTPVVIQANAQQVVVGPDGVVVLPAGVQLSDIAVVGRNLVVTLPDGSQMVIIDGAVFVPQLVLGTVEVPATNLAALLIDSEPRPAAGTPPPSSGGNFGLPPGPLDPGVPLGDLLPPTELAYTPPEVREVNGILDREPTISIDPGNGVPVENAVDSVNEAGLRTRNEGEPAGSGEIADGNGTNDSDPSEATSGTIVYNSPDDPNTVSIDGLGAGGPLVFNVNDLTVIGQQIAGQYGTLTITSIAPGAIGYSYRLNDNVDHDSQPSTDPFTVVITDRDGDSDTATLTVNIVDDVPTARDDTDSIAAGQYGPATGNVITDAAAGDAGDSDTNAADTVGADNATLTLVSGAGGSDSTFNESGNLVVNGQYGVLTIKANGDYSYVRNPGTPGGVNDVFTYTLTDSDGDQDPATLTISIGDATPQTGPNPTALLDDDAVPLANGNPGGVGDDADAANLSGNLAASGGDGPLTYDLLLTGAPAGFTYVDGPNGSVLVQQGGVTVLTITINATTGAYTVTQNAPIDHAALGDENNALFTINYRVTDQDGDPAPVDGTLNINVDDDTPTIGRADVSLPTLTVDETNLALNATGGVAALFQTSFGADGAGSVSYALAVVNGTDSGLVDVATGLPVLLYNIGGVVTGSTSASLAGVTAGNTVFTASINASTGVVTLDQVRALDHPSNPNPNDPVSPTATSIQAVATVTDGDGDPLSLAVNIGSSLVFLDDGPSVDVTLSAAGEPVLLTQDTETDGTPTTQDSASASFAANFLVNTNYGADGAGTQVVSYALGVSVQGVDSGLDQGGANIYLYLIGGVVVGSTSASEAGVTAGNTVFNATVNAAGLVTLTQFSQIDHPIASDPSATGSPFADHVVSLTDTLVTLTATANVTDGDGDPASDSQVLSIGANLQFADDGPDINAALTGTLLKLDETDGVGVPGEVDPVGGNLGTITVAAASLFTVSNVNVSADTPTTLGYTLALSADGVASGLLLSTTNAPIYLYNIGGVVTGSTSATLAGVNAGNTAFTVSVNSGTGAVTMTQFLAVEHTNTASNDEDSSALTAGVLSVRVTATDFDGDTDQASVDLGSIIRFEDDGPTIDVSVNTQAAEPVLLTQDTETDGTPTTQDSASSAVNFGGVFNLAFTTGSDGAATPTLSYALGVSVQGLDSGLDQGGANIYLYLIGGVVVGSTSATEAGVTAGNTVFNVGVNAAGVVTLTQFSQIDHPIAGDPSATGTPFADHVISLTDTMVTLTASSTITDNDGDPASDSATVNIGANLQFADDGPDVAAVLTGTLLKLDETDGVGVPGEVDSVGGNLGTITVAGATLVSVTQPNVSADTPTALVYSLALSVDGVASGLLVSSNNAPIYLYNISGTITGSTSATLAGVNAGNTAFTVSVNSSTGAVTMTQFLAIEHTNTASNDEDSSGLTAGVLSLRVSATDFDGDTDQASVDLGSVIRFEDDGPSAVNDTDSIVGGNGPATGNVLTGVEVAVGEDANNTDGLADNVGSDSPGRITFIDHSNLAPGEVVPNGGSVAIAGTYGVLTIFSNGDYSYLRNDGTPGGVSDVFTYTLTDADGDSVTATLTIGIDDNFPTLPDPALVRLDDDALLGGNADGPDDDANSAGLPGQLAGTGGDGDLDYAFTGINTLPSGFSVNVVNSGTVQVLQGLTVVLTITLDTETGAFNVVQNNPIVHPTLNTLAGDNTENNLLFSIGVQVQDSDGDVEPAAITINVDDDTPTINVTQTNEASILLTTQDAETDGNPTNEDTAVSTANFSGVFGLNQSVGADGGSAATLSYALAVTNAVSGLNSHGLAVNLYLIGGKVVGSTSGTLAGVTAGNTVFDIGVSAGGIVTLTQYSQVDHPIAGDPTATGTPFDDHIISLVNGKVTLTGSSTITDNDGDTVTDQEVVDLGGNIRFADDGPIAANDTVGQTTENQPVTFGVFGNDLFGADGVDTDNNPTVNVTFTQPPAGQGTVSYNAATGQFTFTPAAGQQGSTQFTYTIIDFDGDTSTATVTINLQPDSVPVAADGVAAVDDDGLAGGNAASVTGDLDANASPPEVATVNPSEAIFHGQLVATSGGDTIANYTFASMHGTNGTVGSETVVYSWVNGTSTLTATTVGGTRPGTILFDVVVNQASGEYNLTLRDNVLHIDEVANQENDATTNLTFTVTDSDGDPDTGTIVVTFDDDMPTIGTIQSGTANNNPASPVSSGALNLVIGADSPASVAAIAADNTGVTSGGFNLVTNVVGNVLTAYQDVNSSGAYDAGDTVAVYTLTVDPNLGASGRYIFNLITALDPTVTETLVGGSSSFGAGPTGYQILLNPAGTQDLAVVSGYLVDTTLANADLGDTDTDGVFDFNAWFGGTLVAGDIASAGTNGSVAGWGVDNNNFENENELFFFDFGSQATSDPDAGGPFVPPAQGPDVAGDPPEVQMPNISTATFEFINYSSGVGDAGDDIAYVVHYTDGSFDNGWIPDNAIDGDVQWKFIADPGKFIADIQFFSGRNPSGTVQDLPPGKIDLVSVGIQTSSLTESIGFNVTVQDADGDQVSGAFTVTVADGNTPSTATSMEAYGATKVSSSGALVVDSANDNLKLSGNVTGNTGIVAGVVAASGLMAMPAAAEPVDLGARQADPLALSANGHGQQAVDLSAMDDVSGGRGTLGSQGGRFAVDVSEIASSSRGFDDFNLSDLGLTKHAAGGEAQDAGRATGIEQGPSFDFAASAAFAPAIGIPAAEQLAAAGLSGNVQSGGSVEKVLADALGHGGAATVDALLQGLPGQEVGGNAGFNGLATPLGDHVPAWDMGLAGGFNPGADMMFRMDVAMLHHDAVQPVVNG